MKKLTIALLSFASLPFANLSLAHDECDNARQISWAAHRLDSAAGHFDRVIYNVDGYSHLSRDIQELAATADHLHRLADRGDASCQHIQGDFHQVAHAFNHVSRELRRAHDIHHNHHVMREWRQVQIAYNQTYYTIYGWNGGHGSFNRSVTINDASNDNEND